MRGPYTQFSQLLLLLGLLLCTATSICFALNNSEVRCIEEERQALLKFKQGLIDDANLLSSWGSQEDCCKWKGIECSNLTGHVVRLDLMGNNFGGLNLRGEISSSILGLQHLSYLDLSFNEFSILPEFIGSFTKLQYLSLSHNHISAGTISQQLGNLSSLISLDLSQNELIEDHNLDWLFHLSSLRHLDMSNVDLSKVVNWPDKVNMLPSLLDLLLRNCELSMPNIPPVLSISNSSSPLSFLDLSFNHLNSSIFPWLFKYNNSLVVLHLGRNKLEGSIPKAFGNMVALANVDLSFNNLDGVIPQTLENLHNLQELDLSNNKISGEVPDLSKLSFLRELHLSNNRLNGSLTKSVAELSMLQFLDLSFNRLSGPFPQFNSASVVLSLSNNLFQGSITSICETNGSVNANYMYLSYFNLADNLLFGELPNSWGNMTLLTMLNLANNNLYGRIPDSLCGSSVSLRTLHLQNNSFIGELPKSLIRCSFLELLDIGENRLSGRIPTWIGTSLPHLIVLRLPSNLFMGRIPLQLCHLTSLQILDLSHNNITGTIPKCFNNFTVMAQKNSPDVSISHLFPSSPVGAHSYSTSGYIDDLLVTLKEKYLKYSTTLGLVKVIDLSSNKLKGEIPREIISLQGLIGLNLSRNLLSGTIHHSIGDLERLESLDLSRNHLSGVIPPSLATLTLLSYLNLSNNNLSGSIPTGTQLQSFNASAYADNQDLCGLPLLKRCVKGEAAQGPQAGSKQGEGNIQEHANSHEHLWFYATIALGFIVGFWGVCGSLILKSSWRHAYFGFLERIGDRLYVTIAISMAKLLRNFETQ